MSAAPRTALIATGPVSASWVAKLPGLRLNLEFVKAGSLRVASRIANTLHAGFAVDHYEDLRHAELILIAIPAQDLPDILTEFARASLHWERHVIILCGNRLDTQYLHPLRELGARIGSLDIMDGFDDQRFLFEGDRPALQRLKRLVEAKGKAKIVEMEERRRAVYEAGLTFANGMAFQLIAAAIEAMRGAGLPEKQAAIAVETALMRALRAYVHGGRRGWTGPLAEGDRHELSRQYQGLLETNPALAEVFLKIAIDYLLETGPTLSGAVSRKVQSNSPPQN